MIRPRPGLALSVSSLLAVSSHLAACVEVGVGGDGYPTYALSGRIDAAAGQVVDGDTGDPNALPRVPNDTPAQAQAVPSAVTIGGFVASPSDAHDAFRASLAAGQRITLAIADPVAAGVLDLDLYVYDVRDTTTPLATSEGTGATETIDVTDSGEYYVVVAAIDGASNYVLTFGIAAAAAPTGALRAELEFVPGEVVVRFRDDAIHPAGQDGLAARAAALGMTPLGGALRGRPALLALGETTALRAGALAALGLAPELPVAFGAPLDPIAAAKRDTLRAVKALRARADVESADPNYVFRPSLEPSDPYYRYQWHYPLIDLPQAWDVTTGTPAAGSVVVAVIDTGVYLGHPDFSGQLVGGYDFIADPTRARDGNGIDPNADDPGDEAAAGASSWHGSHVAGTVAARSNEGTGAAGIAWGAKIMPVRVLGAGGGTSYDIIQGLHFAAGLTNDSGTLPTKRADVANLSLGCLHCFSQTEQNAYTAARIAGLVIVAAAGNERSTTPGYPASYAGVVSVSAVDMARARAPYSNSGPNVDIAAPGGDTSKDRDGNGYFDGVLSAVANDSTGTRRPGWAFHQGTSMAAPHVAGVVALMKALCTTLTPAGLDAIIAAGSMTNDLGAPGRDDVFGYGLVDARKAVESAQAACSGTPPPASLDLKPPRLDLGTASTSTVTAGRIGTGALTVQSVADDAAWLSVTAPGSADGLGTYTVTAARSGLADGSYSATVTFTLQDGGAVALPVTLQVGTASGSGDAGFLYVLVVDSNLETVRQAQGRGTAGAYPFTFTGAPAGTYFIVAGTDSDDDGFICEEGEACGAWPTLGVPTSVEVTNANVTGLDFVAGFSLPLGAASAEGGPPPGGFRRMKGHGGGR